MPPKAENRRRSVVIVPSKVGTKAEDIEGGEETEIAAQISIPTDGGWGWVVLVASFCSVFIIDGNAFTFGCLLPDISKDLAVDDSLTVIINSIQTGLYFIISPLSSALINRFGFRIVAMLGSMICSFGLFSSYFTKGYSSLLFFYGVVTGCGLSLISMSASLIVGFYFEKLRSFAMAIVTIGTSFGIMVLNPLNNYFVKLAGWRSTVLFYSGVHGLIYFFALAFRPVLSLTVTKTEDHGEPTKTVTILPSMANTRPAASSGRRESLKPTATERLFSAVSTHYFPTAAAVIHENLANVPQSGTSTADSAAPSSAAVSKIILTAQGAVSRRQLKQMQSMVSRSNFQNESTKTNVEVTLHVEETKKTSCWGRLCRWESNNQEARPIYRDDVFYEGNIKKLAVYQKSVMEIPEENRTGLEYQMAVTRAVTVNDLHERRGVFTTAVRRVLVTMLDPTLLKRGSFLLFCFSGFLTFSGMLVPYVYLQDRNKKAGVDPTHCDIFLSVLSLANGIGRLILSYLSMKFTPIRLYSLGLVIAGMSTVLSSLSYNLMYQYCYSVIFGMSISASAALRSIVIVSTYGLENLTNASGVVIMFLGFGNLISTPLAGALKNRFGYEVSFYVSGCFIAMGGIVAIPVKSLSIKEKAIRDLLNTGKSSDLTRTTADATHKKISFSENSELPTKNVSIAVAPRK